jgi:hypothetical protein
MRRAARGLIADYKGRFANPHGSRARYIDDVISRDERGPC